jgi:hypothetical protein
MQTPSDLLLKPIYEHAPGMRRAAAHPSFDIIAAESLLSDWFEAPVVLLSSGRAGLALYMEYSGCHQYRTKMVVPEFISHCVLGTLALNCFPVHRENGEAALLYHQYGFKQTAKPVQSLVIEDIAHAFFGSAESGGRKWSGSAAVFSLPKFFRTAGLLGGLVISHPNEAMQLAALRDAKPQCDDELLKWRRETVINSHESPKSAMNEALLHGAYALYPVFPAPDPISIASMPRSLDEIRKIGAKRAERMRFLTESLGSHGAKMLPHAIGGIPFAFPYFDNPANLKRANDALAEMGLRAGIYNLDTARNFYDPCYKLALLIPCHHEVPLQLLDDASRSLTSLALK